MVSYSITTSRILPFTRKNNSLSIFEENSLHIDHNKALKLQKEMDNKIRNQYENKLVAQYTKREEEREKENICKRNEYREYLLKQIGDKEKSKHKEIDNYVMQPFSEELTDPTEINNLKLLKQKEEKSGLDACVKMKNDFKLITLQKELEEDQKIAEFCKQRENETFINQEKVKQVAEKKEIRSKEVASLWMAQKDRDVKRDQFIDSLMEKGNITDLDQECTLELLEMQKKINFKKELLRQIEEKVTMSLKNLEDAKREQEKITAELVREEELQKQLYEKERQKKLEYHKILQHALQEKAEKQKKDSDYDHHKNKVLTERNYQCPNNRFFGLD